ncbi:hypothetical protein CDAR_171341 [Caerostris darwini]|uniref:Uncharacterized protein n=1 Tax=Caerostris darwini TaxID=1538125 RepID=A0AAV4WLL9_9ARAC|nr:hypothetical protein CDAR_171341 [Caerostris darwini]
MGASALAMPLCALCERREQPKNSDTAARDRKIPPGALLENWSLMCRENGSIAQVTGTQMFNNSGHDLERYLQ